MKVNFTLVDKQSLTLHTFYLQPILSLQFIVGGSTIVALASFLLLQRRIVASLQKNSEKTVDFLTKGKQLQLSLMLEVILMQKV
ncbi:hypothetical protein QE152_g28323 [Popillia japonica]|uniref:ATP synthase F0 subunit 8 n=1 Tax=Popillia japonica TaxID=7064 RepID=A0AAW1JMZ3_POPJA